MKCLIHIAKFGVRIAKAWASETTQKDDHSNDSADDLDREEPGESEDEEVKRADGHLGRDEQIETRAFF